MDGYCLNNATRIEIMCDLLTRIDRELLLMPAGHGKVAVSNHLQGRIFCTLDGELIHRFDAALAASPSPDRFNNLGGNSLWPGPEGGPVAFNYPADGEWQVQPAVNRQQTVTVQFRPDKTVIAKKMELRNRKNVAVRLDYSRTVLPLDISAIATACELHGIAYRTLDELCAGESYSVDDALFCAWSLEQFPGGENVVAFGRTRQDAQAAINRDYYGDPGQRLQTNGRFFRLELGGTARFQIGLRHQSGPDLIGAYDRQRSLLLLRRAWHQDGFYFNIADNDQPQGPTSASDAYSIFNGGELGFFELETIASLQFNSSGGPGNSTLWSETMIFKGTPQRLGQCLEQYFQIPASLITA